MTKNKYYFPYKDKIYWAWLTDEQFKSTGINCPADELTDEQFKLLEIYL